MKPFWPRTLQLFPAHLQARDAYVEDLLARRVARTAPYAYGLLELVVDEAALAKGEIVLSRMTALFPSGIVATATPDRPLRRPGPATTTRVRAYVGLPLRTGEGADITAADDGVPGSPAGSGDARSSRYAVIAPEGSAGAAPWLRPRPELLYEGEPLDRFEVISLGEIQRIGKALRFEVGAIPTAFHVRASPVLDSGLRSLAGVLERRRAELLRYRADHPLNLKAVASSELPGIQLMAIVQQHLPRLAELAARRAVHPHEVYAVLASLYGALVVFGATEAAPSYDHEDSSQVFPWLFDRIARVVDEAARDRTTSLPFERMGPASYRVAFDRTHLVGKRPFLVATGADEAFLRERVPTLLKMASPAALQPLMQSALRGVAVAVEFEPPAAIPRRRDVVVYRIDVRDPLWLDVEDRMQLQLHLLDAPPALEFVLYGVERSL